MISINFNFHKTLTIKIQINRKIKVHSFPRFRIYLSMIFHLCISFYSKAFCNRMAVVLLWCGQVCPYIIKLSLSS